ncbi:MAG: FGE-sulfatase protein [Gammaproteobacteria bacterium]|nr:FGE-sulfatase protein [Gammaproteobacteria bacterium]
MAETTLRSLAKAYSKKNIEKAAYREARAKFINGVLSGELSLTVNDYPPLIRAKADTTTETTVRKQEKKKRALTEAAISEQPPQPVKFNKGVMAAAIAAVVILAVIGMFIITGDKEEAIKAGGDAAEVSTPAKPNEAQILIRDFLAQRNWAINANLDAFVLKWQALPADTRNNILDTLELNQLTNAIYKQLLEERALSAIGNATDATNKQLKLIEFARQLGINDPRIAMPE